jgi:putative ABC transport system permease protein
MLYFRIVLRNLFKHPLRFLLTVGSLVIALFLLCTLRTLLTTMRAGLEVAQANRLWVQSAVSLFVDLPLSYQSKIEQVAGAERVARFQWFGGYYKDESNQFAQFAVDPEILLELYPEIEIVDGSKEAFFQGRTACLIGKGLAKKFKWKVGDTVPIIGAMFPHPSGYRMPWEFQVAAIYDPSKPGFDPSTFYFHWDYFEKTLEASDTGTNGVGTYVVRVAPGSSPSKVMADIDALFANGPQRVQTTTEAEFNAQFVSMFGNIPFFLSAIGSGVLVAILLACMNTMIMAGREQIRDIGIMKALGFTDGTTFVLLLVQALFLCGLGGFLGIAFALLIENPLAAGLGSYFPGYHILPQTLALAAGVTVVIGLMSGIVPAWQARRLRPVAALSSRE